MGKFYKEFVLKKVLECGAAESWQKIKVGDTVQLILNQRDNLADLKNQVGVLFDTGNDAKVVIGVISEEEGKLIKDFLDMGWCNDVDNKLFKAVISQNDSTKPLENRFKVAVYIEKITEKRPPEQNGQQSSEDCKLKCGK